MQVTNYVANTNIGYAMQDCTYDAVVDKATLDCLMNCKEWQGKVHAMLTEAHRVLHLGGK